MSSIYFMNRGEFDVRAMMTFGVSVKEKEDAIGFFGTGFKFAVAIILRLGGSINIMTKGKTFSFTSRKEDIRGKDFDIVYMNDQEAGFTTHLGANWEPWMAFRELYCNAKDENGIISEQIDYSYDNETIVAVNCKQIVEAFRKKEDYFVSGTILYEDENCEIYDKPSLYYFYRGVAVRNLPEVAKYTYNVKAHVELTEDRTAKHEYQVKWPVQKTVQNCHNSVFVRDIITSKEGYESVISFDKDWGCSVEFLETARVLIKQDIGVRESVRRFVAHFDNVLGVWPEFSLSNVQQKQLDKAVSFLSRMDIPVKEFPIKTVNGLGDSVMGRAHEGVIYLSHVPFNMGTKQLAGTLLEEYIHLKHGFSDFDRGMQNWLFDKVISLGEDLIGEPV